MAKRNSKLPEPTLEVSIPNEGGELYEDAEDDGELYEMPEVRPAIAFKTTF